MRFHRWYRHPEMLPGLKSFICSFRRAKGMTYGKEQTAWEGMASDRDRNVNSRMDACLKIFLVGFYPWGTTRGYRREATYEAIEGRCDSVIGMLNCKLSKFQPLTQTTVFLCNHGWCGLNCVPPKFIHGSPNSHCLRLWLYLEAGSSQELR